MGERGEDLQWLILEDLKDRLDVKGSDVVDCKSIGEDALDDLVDMSAVEKWNTRVRW